jgi:multidrug efflux pump subunit AcrA (membrane-fusion protein)
MTFKIVHMKWYHLFIALFFLASCKSNVPEISPQKKDLVEMVFASGTLQADDQYSLTAQTEGYLTRLTFKEGDAVRAGQLLAFIDNNQNIINAQSAVQLQTIAANNTLPSAPALQQIQANIEAAGEKLKLDQTQADRYKRLYETNSVAKLEYENAQLAVINSQANLNALQQQYNNQKIAADQQEVSQRSFKDINRVIKDQNLIKAIVTGRIYEKKKQLGDYVRKGDVIAIIGNPGLIYAQLNVDETNMGKLQVGQEAIVQLNTNKNKTYKATIHEILPSFDANSQSFIIKAWFTDSLDFRIAGTQLEANIITGEKKNALVIPRAYLGYGNKVILKNKKTVIVKTGIVSNEWVEILDGITENDVLILTDK